MSPSLLHRLQTVTPPDSFTAIPSAIVGSIFLLGLGTVLVYEGSRKKSFVPTFLGSTMLLMGMTPTINATFKISDIFKLEKLEVTLPKPEKLTLHSSVEHLGRIQNFSPGCADLAGKLCLEKKDRLTPQALEYLGAESTLTPPEKLWEAICHIKSPLLITGQSRPRSTRFWTTLRNMNRTLVSPRRAPRVSRARFSNAATVA